MDWRQHPDRGCAYADPDLFFPASQRMTPQRAKQEAEAKAVCRGCPVTAECLSCALAHQEVGVWGGTTEDERKQIREWRRRPNRRTQLGSARTPSWLAG